MCVLLILCPRRRSQSPRPQALRIIVLPPLGNSSRAEAPNKRGPMRIATLSPETRGPTLLSPNRTLDDVPDPVPADVMEVHFAALNLADPMMA